MGRVTQEPGISTSVIEQIRPDERTVPVEDGDHERLSHFVPKDKLMEATINGTPVVALCGKVWVPTRDPERFPVCPECKDILENFSEGKE